MKWIGLILLAFLITSCCSEEVTQDVRLIEKTDTLYLTSLLPADNWVVDRWDSDSVVVKHDTLWRLKIVREKDSSAAVSMKPDTIRVIVPGKDSLITTTTTTHISFMDKLRYYVIGGLVAVGAFVLMALIAYLVGKFKVG